MQAIQKREVTAEFRAEGVKLIIKQGPRESEVARARHERGRQTYGPKRMRIELDEVDLTLSLAAVERIRNRLGPRYKQTRKYEATTDSKDSLLETPICSIASSLMSWPRIRRGWPTPNISELQR